MENHSILWSSEDGKASIEKWILNKEQKTNLKRVSEVVQPDLIDHPKMKGLMFGKECREPRSVRLFEMKKGEVEEYQYSKTVQIANQAPIELINLTNLINGHFKSEYNAALVNQYKPEDSIGDHSDAEKTLDQNTGVVCVSYGATRNLIFKDKASKERKIVLKLPMESGDVIVMKGDCQKLLTHGIRPEKRTKGVRLSITWRKHIKKNK